jgi:lipoprotein-anchoring transpeptidase ErfK/SrfK
LRASISLVVISVAVVGSAGTAAAQYYPSAYPPPQAYPQPYPPAPPPGPYYGRSPYGDASGPYDPRYSGVAAPEQDAEAYPPPPGRGYYPSSDGLAPQPVPAIGQEPFTRPPGDVGEATYQPPDANGPDVTGSVRGSGSVGAGVGGGRPSVVAGLPPEDQPDQGPAKDLPPQFRRQLVDYTTTEPAGTIIIDTPNTYLYLVLGNRKAMRYGIGVGREGFTWTGTERISRAKEWPDWFPPKEMIERQPYLPRFMAGGETNPLGARALYLGNTLYRIHGTNQPSTIGTFVSSGCIRLTNDDIADLYSRVGVGTRVVVLPGSMPASASIKGPIAR